MARLQQVELSLTTGTEGITDPVRIRINGHVVPVPRASGGTGPGETFRGTAWIGSVVHSLELLGPEQGRWRITRLEAHFTLDRGEPYSNELGPLMLEPGHAVDIWTVTDSFSV